MTDKLCIIRPPRTGRTLSFKLMNGTTLMSPFDSLPTELIISIAAQLDPHSLLGFKSVRIVFLFSLPFALLANLESDVQGLSRCRQLDSLLTVCACARCAGIERRTTECRHS